MAIYHHMDQRSPEWYSARLGIPTASAFHRIVTPRCKRSSQAESYMNSLLAEWALGAGAENPFESEAMAAGKALEPRAVAAFEFETELETQEVGFVTTDDGLIGASPDRLIGDDACLEVKCPSNPGIHIGYLRSGGVEEAYRCQVQGQLWVCEREISYTVSYCAGLPTAIHKVSRDEPFIRMLSAEVRRFVEELLEAREKLIAEHGKFGRFAETELSNEDPLGLSDADIDEICRASFGSKSEGKEDARTS